MKQFSLEDYLKNPNQKVVTRDGRKVRVICTDFDNELYPIIGGVQGEPFPRAFTKEGLLCDHTDTDSDLFFATEKREVWINVFEDTIGSSCVESCIFKSREDAEKAAKNYSVYITTIKMDWEE